MATETVVELPDREDLALLKYEIEQARLHTLKALGRAGRIEESELHKRLSLAVTVLDDCRDPVVDAHLYQRPIQMPEAPIDAEATLREFAEFVVNVQHEFPEPEACRRIRVRALAITQEIG